MMEHTKEPWSTEYRKRYDGQFAQEIFDSQGETIATLSWYPVKVSETTTGTNREKNARRIVACVNACEGIETEDLKGFLLSHDWEQERAIKMESDRDRWKAMAVEAKNMAAYLRMLVRFDLVNDGEILAKLDEIVIKVLEAGE